VVERVYRAALAGETTSVELPRNDKVFAVTTVPVRDDSGAVTAGLALIYDVTLHKLAEATVRDEAEAIRSQSVRDELTGLYNRRGFLELSRQQLSIAAHMARPALLFFVDLNGMKSINDRLGHEQGDQALAETAEILRATFRTSDVLARLGGDEFVALLMDADVTQQASFEARVQREVDLRNARSGRAFQLSLSIGSAAFDPTAPQTIDALVARADAVMYEQKRQRKAGR
jgi:diguanylate cyclase (GGDEF)-like protein